MQIWRAHDPSQVDIEVLSNTNGDEPKAPPLGMSQAAYDELKKAVEEKSSFQARGALGSQFTRWLGHKDIGGLYT
eukprot:5911141-Pyramimonas_sp.AAC.1